MADAPIELVVAAFQDEQGAENALKELKNAKREQLIAIKDAAVIRRDVNDKVHIKDVRDVGGGKGAVAGAIFGTAIALLTGPVGIVLGGAAGALVGGLTAKAVDMGLPNARLKELAEALKPGTSAIVAIIEHTWVSDIEQMMADAGAAVMRDAIKADITEQLEAGRNISYSALATDESTSLSRVAGDEDSVEISGLTLTDDGLAAQATVMTKEGAVSHGLVLTEDGMISGTAVALPDEEADEEEKTDDTGSSEEAPKDA